MFALHTLLKRAGFPGALLVFNKVYTVGTSWLCLSGWCIWLLDKVGNVASVHFGEVDLALNSRVKYKMSFNHLCVIT